MVIKGRMWFWCVVLAAAVACNAGAADKGAGTADYAVARTSFHTKLVKHGPAPQPWVPTILPASARSLTFKSGGLSLEAWISGDGKPPQHPAVLFLHGGFAFGEDDWEMTKPFRDAGFIVMMPRLRGENGQPGDFSLFFDEVDDVLAAATALARQPDVDAKHIYVAGHSAGGTLTMLAAMASKQFRAAASLSGSPDLRKFVDTQRELIVFDPRNDDELRIRSPLDFATSFKCPTRLYRGSREAYFAKTTAELASRAQAGGLDVREVVVPGDHLSMTTPAILQAIEFFRSQQ